MDVQQSVKGFVAKLLRMRIVRAILLYTEHRGSMLADSVTYRALFSIFAGVLLGFSIAALVIGGNPDAMRALGETLNSVIPGLSDIVDPTKITAPTGFSIVGGLSLIGIIGAAIGAVTSLRTALRELAGEVHQDGFFLWVYARNLLVAIGFAALIGAAALVSAIGALGVATVAEWLGLSIASTLVRVLSQVTSVVIVFAVDAVAIVLVFRLLSGVKAPSRALWGGAMLGAVGLTVLQTLSGLFVRGATSNPLLATFSVLIALLLWVNFSVQVVLIASSYIITATAEAHDRIREQYGAQTLADRRVQRAEDLVDAATRELRDARAAQCEEAKNESGSSEA